MTLLDALLARLHGAKKSGHGWIAQCPAHNDRNPSLRVDLGHGGRILLHCHALCTPENVVAAVGMTLADLMPQNPVYETSRKPAHSEVSLTHVAKPKQKQFSTAQEAIAALERNRGPCSGKWEYHNRADEVVGLMLRWNEPGGKKHFVAISLCGEAWVIGGMPEPRLLYNLPALRDAAIVYVPEGEKAVDALLAMGLVATTSAHGAKSPHKSDWSPLAGKKVVILPDNDEAGEAYAESVFAELQKVLPAPSTKIVRLPDLPPHGDIVDWQESQGAAADPKTLRKALESLVEEADWSTPQLSAARVESFRPFPLDALPEPLRTFVKSAASAIGCDPCFVTMPLLTVMAAAIGNARRLQLKRSWSVPPILWTAIVGESGSAKSPAFKLVMRVVREMQQKSFDLHAQQMREYQVKLAQYEKEFAIWKKREDARDEPPVRPDIPVAKRFIVSDITVEALAAILVENPRGVLLAVDELASWLASFDRYTTGKSSGDAPRWLSMHAGDQIIVDRKTGFPRTLVVPQAAVCICGGIQPAILHRALGVEHRESGLAARFLLACPPQRAKRWTEADVALEQEQAIAYVLDRLHGLQSAPNTDGQSTPVVLGLTREAKVLWTQYFDAHAEEQSQLTGEEAAAWSKLEESAARLALVIQLTKWAADGNDAGAELVDAESMESGIQLATWFKGEVQRVYAMLRESEAERNRRKLIEWIEAKGTKVTARYVQANYRPLKPPGMAEKELAELVKDGLGRWNVTVPGASGGRPSQVFELIVSTSTKPQIP